MRLLSSVAFFGVDGKPILVEGGYSCIKYRYNSQTQRIETSYYGTDGTRANNSSGFCREVYIFRDGTEYKCEWYAASGKKLATAIRKDGQWNILR